MLYKAFFSYSHAADDKLASALQSALHQFARPWYKLRAVRIFRDKTSLSANSALWPSIETALKASEYLLLLASPDAARSRWVEREVVWWLENRSTETMLVLLTEGELIWDSSSRDFDWSRTTVLPGSLKGKIKEEPLHVDLRWGRQRRIYRSGTPNFEAQSWMLPRPCLDGPKTNWMAMTSGNIAGSKSQRGWQVCSCWCWLSSQSSLPITRIQNADIAEARRIQSEEQRARADAQRNIAEERCRQADEAGEAEQTERLEADKQRNLAVARQLAAEAGWLKNERLETSALLAVESARRLPGFESDQVLRKSLDLLPKPIAVLRHGKGVRAVAFSGDGRMVVTGSEHGQSRIFEAASGKQLMRFQSDCAVSVVAFSREGRYLATACENGKAQVVDVATRQKTVSPSHQGGVYDLAFSPNGRDLAIGGTDGTAQVFEAANGKQVGPRMIHQGGVFKVAFSPDGSRLATASLDSTQHVFEIGSGKEVARLHHEYGVNAMAVRSDTQWVAVAFGYDVRVLEMATGKEVARLIQEFDVGDMDFSPDDRRLVIGSEGEDNAAV